MTDIEILEVDPEQDPTDGAEVLAFISGRPPSGGPPSGGAGGVLSGQYPNPGFAVNMATQGELDGHVDAAQPHPAYDDLPSMRLIYENALI